MKRLVQSRSLQCLLRSGNAHPLTKCEFLKKRWGAAIAYDPAINSNNVALISETDVYVKHEFDPKYMKKYLFINVSHGLQ